MIYVNFLYIWSMQRRILTYGGYFERFIQTLTRKEIEKVEYVLSLLETEDKLPVKFIKYIQDDLFELRVMYSGKIFRVFFIFDQDRIVVLFNGFQKKTRKTPKGEIEKALKIKAAYYERKR